MARILIVDDEPTHLRQAADLAVRAGYLPVTATSGKQALDMLRSDPLIRAVLLDLVMPDLDGLAVLEAMRREAIAVPVVAQTTQSGLDTVATLMRMGAADFVVKPVSQERFGMAMRNALRLNGLETLLRHAKLRAEGRPGSEQMLGNGPGMDRVQALAAKAARNGFPILIEGEAGTGKSLLARIIHTSSERGGRSLVTLNCADHAARDMEILMFGQRRGAEIVPGLVQEANGGTLVLEEIGELPVELQERLAVLIDKGEYRPAEGERTLRASVRIIATTSKRLLNLTKAGAVREDLFYRLNVLPIYLPPLRDRGADPALLANHFLTRFATETGKRLNGVSDAALHLIKRQSWPGNVRQLEALIYRAVVLSEGAELDIADFPQLLIAEGGRERVIGLAPQAAASAPVHIDDPSLSRRDPVRLPAVADRFLAANGEVVALADMERDLIAFALSHYGYRMSRVARALGIGRSTLYRKLREYGLDEGLESDAA